MTDAFNQLPPHSIEAEQCVIGSLALLSERHAEQRELLGLLAPAAFFLEDHQVIWQACRDVVQTLRVGEKADAVLIREMLVRRGKLEEVGGTAYLAEILNTVPSAANWRHYAQIVRDKAHQRLNFKFTSAAMRDAMENNLSPLAISRRVRDQMDALIRRASSTIDRSGAAAEVEAEMRAEADGRRRNEPFPWQLLTRLARALLPSSIVLLCGGPGAGKTWLILQAMLFWLDHGIPFSARMLEKPRRWHVRRALALIAQDLRLMDDQHVRENPDWYTTRAGEFAETLDLLGERVHTNELSDGSHIDLLGDWVEQRANAGDRVICVDPITLADVDGERMVAQQTAFMKRAGDVVSRTGSTLLLITHPRTSDGKRPPTLDDFAGGRVFSRACDAAIYLQRLDGFRRASLITDLSTRASRCADVDRLLKIHKGRDGTGEGLSIAMSFDRNRGGLTELGVVDEWIDEAAEADAIPAGL